MEKEQLSFRMWEADYNSGQVKKLLQKTQIEIKWGKSVYTEFGKCDKWYLQKLFQKRSGKSTPNVEEEYVKVAEVETRRWIKKLKKRDNEIKEKGGVETTEWHRINGKLWVFFFQLGAQLYIYTHTYKYMICLYIFEYICLYIDVIMHGIYLHLYILCMHETTFNIFILHINL